jgi:hypothetical protein
MSEDGPALDVPGNEPVSPVSLSRRTPTGRCEKQQKRNHFVFWPSTSNYAEQFAGQTLTPP